MKMSSHCAGNPTSNRQFEVFTAIVQRAEVQMCFAPEAEAEFFGALRAGQFDVHAVCSSVDADLATATEPADKAMIADRIRQANIYAYGR